MKKILLPILILVMGGITQVSGQVLTGFGTGGTNPLNTATDFLSPWTGAQTTNSVTVTSQTASGGGIYSNLSTDVAISNIGSKFLTLTGDLLSPSVSKFSITVYDNTVNQNTLTYNFTFSEFLGGDVAFSGALTDPADLPSFGGTIGAYEIDPGGIPGSTVSFRFDQLAYTTTFVPEPSTYAMFGFGLFMLYFVSRRKTARLARA